MARSDEEHSDELRELSKRLSRLENRVSEANTSARRSWQAAAGLSAGGTALALSLSLPWLRAPGREAYGAEASFSLDAEAPLRLGEPRPFATGWEMWGASLTNLHTVSLVFLAMAVLGALVVAAVLIEERWPFHAAQACSLLLVLLLLIVWPRDPESTVVLGPGPVVVVLACLLILFAADRGKPEPW